MSTDAYTRSVEEDARKAILQLWDYAESKLRTTVVDDGWVAGISPIQPDDWGWLEAVAARIVQAAEARRS